MGLDAASRSVTTSEKRGKKRRSAAAKAFALRLRIILISVSRPLRLLFFGFVVFALAAQTTVASKQDRFRKVAAAVKPLGNAHAHNDYAHPRPLLDALDNGFCSVEADVHLVNGELLVAHDVKDVKPGRTLEALYLEPLRQRARKNKGRIYVGGPTSITLLIDVKTDSASTYTVLRSVLARYKDILTEWRTDGTTDRAVTVVVSGARPTIADLSIESPRYAAYDGRLSDLDRGVSPFIMPLVSESWSAVSKWTGDANVALPDTDRTHIEAIVAKAHAQGYRLRFWATPDTSVAWRALRDLNVDLINADDLSGLRRFLLEQNSRPHDAKPIPKPRSLLRRPLP